MSLPSRVVMPGDTAPNPFTIPGTTRVYRCAAGASISVNGDDAQMLLNAGWVSAGAGAMVGSGPTSGRPANPMIGQSYHDTTIGAIVIYAGPRTGWLHHSTGVVC